MIRLHVKWLDTKLPFFWLEQDFVEVSADGTIEDLAAALSATFHSRTREYRGDVEYDFQAEFINVGRTRVLEKSNARVLPYGDRVDAYFLPHEISSEGNVVMDEVKVRGSVVPKAFEKATLSEDAKIPVIILTGFLGSGKTTLLNYILSVQRERKVAVLENEFGEIGIDQELIQQKFELAEDVVLMDNGCICCAVRTDIIEALSTVQKKIAQGHRIDLVLVETSGMADPVPIVKSFQNLPWVTELMRYDGCITVVDAKNCLTRLDLPVEEGAVNEAEKQIAFADKVILNKIDLVDFDETMRVNAKIKELNQFVNILPAVKGEVKVDELLNLHAHDLSRFDDEGALTSDEDSWLMGLPYTSRPTKQYWYCPQDASMALAMQILREHEHRHDSRVNSIAMQQYGEMPERGIHNLLRIFKYMNTYDKQCFLFRVKGVFGFEGWPQKYAYHTVMDVQENEVIGHWKPGERKMCKLVVIGRNIDSAFIQKAFKAAMMDELTVTYSNFLGVQVKFKGEKDQGCKTQ